MITFRWYMYYKIFYIYYFNKQFLIINNKKYIFYKCILKLKSLKDLNISYDINEFHYYSAHLYESNSSNLINNSG